MYLRRVNKIVMTLQVEFTVLVMFTWDYSSSRDPSMCLHIVHCAVRFRNIGFIVLKLILEFHLLADQNNFKG